MSQHQKPNNQKHWLYREENRSKLWKIQFGILILAILPDLFMHHHASFENQGIHLDASTGFYAWYGFLTCAAMVLGAKLLGFVLKRKDDYYDDDVTDDVADNDTNDDATADTNVTNNTNEHSR